MKNDRNGCERIVVIVLGREVFYTTGEGLSKEKILC